MATGRQRRLRNERIVADYAAMSSIAQITGRYGMSRRQVFAVLAATALPDQRRVAKKSAAIASQADTVAMLRAEGLYNKEIADRLGICQRTVDNMISRKRKQARP